MACFFFSVCALRVVHLCKICTGHPSYSMIVACTAGHLLCDIWKCSELRDLAHIDTIKCSRDAMQVQMRQQEYYWCL